MRATTSASSSSSLSSTARESSLAGFNSSFGDGVESRATLVFPSIVTAGFVVGGSYGEGGLRVGGQTAGYYKTAAGSVGLLAGAESKAMYILFMTDEALAKFRTSNGWTVGADASVAMIRTGASAAIDSATAQQAVIGYVLTKGGLMANLSLEGTRVTRLDI